jgi:hypothetical protein
LIKATGRGGGVMVKWHGNFVTGSRMHKTVSLFILTIAVIIAAWWRLGAAVEMPPAPLNSGEKLHCVSYAPFRGPLSPLDLSTKIDQANRANLAQLSRITDCVAPIRSISPRPCAVARKYTYVMLDCGFQATPTAPSKSTLALPSPWFST